MSRYVEPRVDRGELTFTGPVKPRKHLAVVANTGAGKSLTLWSLLARMAKSDDQH